MKVKQSDRWHNYPNTRSIYPLEYIAPDGRFSYINFGEWKTNYPNLLTTCISTIFARLANKYARRKGEKFVQGKCMELVAIATIYALTRNEHFFNRCNYLLRNKMSPILNGYLISSVTKLDDNTRFVLCQAWRQAYWLCSRSNKVVSREATEGFYHKLFDLKKFLKDLDDYNDLDSFFILDIRYRMEREMDLSCTIREYVRNRYHA